MSSLIDYASMIAKARREKQQQELIVYLIALQKQQLDLLQMLEQGVERLLVADFAAASQHLEYSRLEGRNRDVIISDIAKARDLFIRALGQTDSRPSQAVVRINIAICASLLEDIPVARHEAKQALELIDESVAQVQYWYQWGTDASKTANNVLDDMPWWSPAKASTQRHALKVTQVGESHSRALERLIPLQQSIQTIWQSFEASP